MAWVRPITKVVRHRLSGPTALIAALAMFAICLAARFWLGDHLNQVAYLTFFPAVVASTLFCGWRSGVLVCVLSMLSGWYFFLEPRNSFALKGSGTSVVLAGFLAVALFQVALVAALAEVVRRLDDLRAVQADLFRELQHRVANNMQLIASTLRVARSGARDPNAAREVIEHATARVEAMARLHRRLYDPESYRQGLEPVLRDLLAEAFQDVAVKVLVDLAPRDLSVSQMTAIVLLVNEAALNAAKHVFRPERGSAFEVLLRPTGDNAVHQPSLQLIVRDDGPGLAPVPVASAPARRLGMTIMQSLARQLGGTLEVLPGPGLVLGVTFNAYEPVVPD